MRAIVITCLALVLGACAIFGDPGEEAWQRFQAEINALPGTSLTAYLAAHPRLRPEVVRGPKFDTYIIARERHWVAVNPTPSDGMTATQHSTACAWVLYTDPGQDIITRTHYTDGCEVFWETIGMR